MSVESTLALNVLFVFFASLLFGALLGIVSAALGWFSAIFQNIFQDFQASRFDNLQDLRNFENLPVYILSEERNNSNDRVL